MIRWWLILDFSQTQATQNIGSRTTAPTTCSKSGLALNSQTIRWFILCYIFVTIFYPPGHLSRQHPQSDCRPPGRWHHTVSRSANPIFKAHKQNRSHEVWATHAEFHPGDGGCCHKDLSEKVLLYTLFPVIYYLYLVKLWRLLRQLPIISTLGARLVPFFTGLIEEVP